jgi:hypothetical protein
MTKKNGLVNNIQLYKCHHCQRQFLGGKRIDNGQLWKEYVYGKQTFDQLSAKHQISIKTIQRRLEKVRIQTSQVEISNVIVLMDTTYFGRKFGVMLFKDSISGHNLYKQYVKYETNKLYYLGIECLKSKGFNIKAIVCDGRKGLLQSFPGIPVQMCQFHQVAIIRRYITKNPKMSASIELKLIVDLLKHTDRESFEGALNNWYSKWEKFLKERTLNQETGKSHYTHKRLRSAYRSLRTNLPWLFTWSDYPDLKIPNTTNSIDGVFADLKNKLRNHNGLSLKHKAKFIDEFLKA